MARAGGGADLLEGGGGQGGCVTSLGAGRLNVLALPRHALPCPPPALTLERVALRGGGLQGQVREGG